MYRDCKLTQIMAVTKDGFIGDNNTIPWRCKEDMRHFARSTKGKVCIMGRNTFESINPPLKNRYVIVITSSNEIAARVGQCDLHVAVNTLDAALELASDMSLDKEIMIVGGRQIYQQTMQYTDKLLLSTINLDLGKGDTKLDWEFPDHVEVIPFEFEPDL